MLLGERLWPLLSLSCDCYHSAANPPPLLLRVEDCYLLACNTVLPVVVWEVLPLTPLLGGCDIFRRLADLQAEQQIPPLLDVFSEAFLPPSPAPPLSSSATAKWLRLLRIS